MLAKAQRVYRIVGKLIYYIFLVFSGLGKLKQRRIGSLSPINLALIPTDMNPLGFMDDLSMRGVRSLDLVDGDDVHGPTTAFQDRALATKKSTSPN